MCVWYNKMINNGFLKIDLYDFEIEYFNTGAEWRISESGPDGDENYYFYTHSWSDDGTRAEIAAAKRKQMIMEK